MSVVDLALKRPYTVVAALILICLMGIGAALRMPVDIFPEIDIPVVAVVWTYSGMSAEDIQNRILTFHERQMASLVDDISRIEAVSYEGVGVEKVYLHEGADVTRAISQLASSALVVLKYMPRNITPPLVLRYGATDVPIIQLSLSSKSLPDTKLNDLGQNIIRPALAVVHGAEVPYPYGGKPRVIMADLDSQALQARGLSASDVSTALQSQNVILPAGDVKIGEKDYTLTMNNSPDVIDRDQRISHQANRRPYGVHARCGARSRWVSSTDQFGVRRWDARGVDDHPQDRRSVHPGRDRRGALGAQGHPEGAAAERLHQGFVRSVAVRQGRAQQRIAERLHGGRLDRPGHHSVPRQHASVPDHPRGNSIVHHHRRVVHRHGRPNPEHHDPGRLRPGDRHTGRQRHGGDREHRAACRHERTAAAIHRGRARAKWPCRHFCPPCAFASCSCRCSCCRARRSICSRPCPCR